MIISEIFYGVKCDRCEEVFEGNDSSFWMDSSTSEEEATDDGWHRDKHRHFCPCCHEVNEETEEVTIFEPFPDHLKKLNKFIDKIICASSSEIKESENEFRFHFTLYQSKYQESKKLECFEESYVRNILGDKFSSIAYMKGVNSPVYCLIVIKK